MKAVSIFSHNDINFCFKKRSGTRSDLKIVMKGLRYYGDSEGGVMLYIKFININSIATMLN